MSKLILLCNMNGKVVDVADGGVVGNLGVSSWKW